MRIAHGCHAVLVKIIPHRNHKFRSYVLGGLGHLPGHFNLVSIALAAPIAKNEEIQSARLGGGLKTGRHEALRDHSLRGHEENAHKFTSCLRHTAYTYKLRRSGSQWRFCEFAVKTRTRHSRRPIGRLDSAALGLVCPK